MGFYSEAFYLSSCVSASRRLHFLLILRAVLVSSMKKNNRQEKIYTHRQSSSNQPVWESMSVKKGRGWEIHYRYQSRVITEQGISLGLLYEGHKTFIFITFTANVCNVLSNKVLSLALIQPRSPQSRCFKVQISQERLSRGDVDTVPSMTS